MARRSTDSARWIAKPLRDGKSAATVQNNISRLQNEGHGRSQAIRQALGQAQIEANFTGQAVKETQGK